MPVVSGSAAFGSIISFFLFSHSITHIRFGPWMSIGSLTVYWDFYFDAITLTMLFIVTSISFLVQVYSLGYMGDDPHFIRFMSYLSLFTFCMLLLVTAGNYIQLFFGWEGVGICSYLLINFWFYRIAANKAAFKAVLINRFGDFGLLVAMGLMYTIFKSLDFSIVFPLVPFFFEKSFFIFDKVFAIELLALFLVLAAIGKSAQVGLHIWLPDAMEGPTPVSALIHAATMVTAGIFLLIRSSWVLEYAPYVLSFVTIIGALTAFFSATAAVVQNDLKKVIAYSTCSQLGYMFFCCGLSNYTLSLFHLANHAFFKALLFLSAGVVIHGLNNEQDMRKMGGLVLKMPFTYFMFFIASLALAGFPFLTGFYSKDIIIELASASNFSSGNFSKWFALFAAFFTAVYSTRLICMTFFGVVNSSQKNHMSSQEGTAPMLLAQLILFSGTVFFGFFLKELFIGVGTDFFSNSIAQVSLGNSTLFLEAEFQDTLTKWLPLFVSIFGFFFWLALANSGFIQSTVIAFSNNSTLVGNFFWEYYYVIYYFLARKWYFDKFYLKILFSFYHQSYKLFKWLDKGILEFFGPTGFGRFFLAKGAVVASFSDKNFFNSMYFIFVSFILSSLFLLYLYKISTSVDIVFFTTCFTIFAYNVFTTSPVKQVVEAVSKVKLIFILNNLKYEERTFC